MKKEKGPAPLPPSQATNSTIPAAPKESVGEKAAVVPKANDNKIVDLLQRTEVAVAAARTVVDGSDSIKLSDSKVCLPPFLLFAVNPLLKSL